MLWSRLRSRSFLDLKFRQQHPIGKYIADFYCHKIKLVIEVDGGYHLSKGQKEKDDFRDADMVEHDLHVLRFTNEEILESIDVVLEKIRVVVLEIEE